MVQYLEPETSDPIQSNLISNWSLIMRTISIFLILLSCVFWAFTPGSASEFTLKMLYGADNLYPLIEKTGRGQLYRWN